MGSDEAFEGRVSVSAPVSNSVGVPELDALLKEHADAWLAMVGIGNARYEEGRKRHIAAADAIRTLFTSTRSPETHSEREPGGWITVNKTTGKMASDGEVTYASKAEVEPWVTREEAVIPVYFGTPPAVVDTTREDVEVCEWNIVQYTAACGFDAVDATWDLSFRFCPKCGKPLRVVEKDGEE